MKTGSKILSIFGIPIVSATEEDLICKIIKLIEDYPTSQHPQLVTSVKTALLLHGSSWNGSVVRYQELFHVLRTAAVFLPEGGGIRLLCRALNFPLREKLLIRQLMFPLAKALGERCMSLFIVGNDLQEVQQLAKALWESCPGLEIVGTLALDIQTQGADILNSAAMDQIVLEQIHRVHPDILYIAVNSPKGEIWFERVKHHLRVPVSVIIGKDVDQEVVKALWGKCVDAIKMVYLTVPLVVYHKISYSLYHLIYHKSNQELDKTLLFFSHEKSITIVKLPVFIDKNICPSLEERIDEAFDQDIVILDFKNVCHLDLGGVALLLKIWIRSQEEKKELYGLNMKEDVKFLLHLHRVWDLVSGLMCKDAKEVMARLSRDGTKSALFESIQQEHTYVILTFFGRLDNHKNYEIYLEQLLPIIYKKNCMLDLTYCIYIDNSGFAFLLRLQEQIKKQKKLLKVCGLQKSVEHAFKIARLYDRFPIYRNQETAWRG